MHPYSYTNTVLLLLQPPLYMVFGIVDLTKIYVHVCLFWGINSLSRIVIAARII